ncbi:MAG TPA: ParB/RepB/Spo0J family partition protein [Candidatus Elarobacter sp.]|jgi:hypothetical protein
MVARTRKSPKKPSIVDEPLLIETHKISDLHFDPDNPRLPESVRRKDLDILAYLADETALHELMQTIGENGFFVGEPLIGFPKDGRIFIVEGNRRLAALQLLNDPLSIQRRTSIVEAARDARYKPTSVPVVMIKRRGDAATYLGYRHITGVKQWDSLSKARYLAYLFNEYTDSRKKSQDRYRQVARIIGSRYPYIKRILDAFALYEIAEEKDFYDNPDVNDRNLPFSLLSTAMGYDDIRSYVVKGNSDPIVSPSRSISAERAEKLFGWLYRKEDGKTRLGESRELGKLAVVVKTSSALKAFDRGASLSQAYVLTQGVVADFETQLNAAITHLSAAFGLMPQVRTGSAVSLTVKRQIKQVMQYAQDLSTLAE